MAPLFLAKSVRWAQVGLIHFTLEVQAGFLTHGVLSALLNLPTRLSTHTDVCFHSRFSGSNGHPFARQDAQGPPFTVAGP